ncbi:hypothetical protein ND806_03365 [Leptospira sp. 2 VSF17]|nr:hypothetical protein [Leptospira soteropolitanensis]
MFIINKIGISNSENPILYKCKIQNRNLIQTYTLPNVKLLFQLLTTITIPIIPIQLRTNLKLLKNKLSLINIYTSEKY